MTAAECRGLHGASNQLGLCIHKSHKGGSVVVGRPVLWKLIVGPEQVNMGRETSELDILYMECWRGLQPPLIAAAQK